MGKLKTAIARLLPAPLLRLAFNVRAAIARKEPAKDVFTEIKSVNLWESKESLSGPGSELLQTKTLVEELPKVYEMFNIKSVLDIPCGDFNWMRHVACKSKDVAYHGADIVEELVIENSTKYGTGNISFSVLDIISDRLPSVDMVFVRDCLVHLSYKDIKLAIENIRKSGSKYLMATTFYARRKNHDIITGKWRPLNMQGKPFRFPEPEFVLVENCTEGDGKYQDKAMGLWLVEAIP